MKYINQNHGHGHHIVSLLTKEMEHPVRAHRIAFVIQQELADSLKRNQIIYILMMDMLDLQLCMYEQQQAALCMY